MMGEMVGALIDEVDLAEMEDVWANTIDGYVVGIMPYYVYLKARLSSAHVVTHNRYGGLHS